MKTKTLLAIALVGVTLDVLTTIKGLSLPNVRELNPFGFNPLREYVLMTMLVLGMSYVSQILGKLSKSENVAKAGRFLTVTLALIPYTAALNNLWVIVSG